ncbi:MAG: ATP-grasp domain-containing protein [Cyanobacteria bacterium REEB67]|nr:ATP-grasp domain-containing protein [Cyanobacteria bacterium REEB67]
MISVFLSPNFPPNYVNFATQLRAEGAIVLGLGDDPFEDLSHELRVGLTEYYRVANMHNYDELLRALGYFTHRYGKIGHLDSHNEYWLETEARLRTDFNIPGIKMDTIYKIKRKSEMKEVFRLAGLNPARGRVCRDEKDLRDFISDVGYPICAKPDIGVGAAKTFKMSSDDEIANYLQEKLSENYIVEEFIDGQIVSFDGLVDGAGVPLFTSSLRYSKGVMEAVNDDSDIYYYTVRKIEPAVVAAGLATVKAFDVRGRFFHFEFFLKSDGRVVPLEVNMRPPGGLTLNMFNYMFDFDCYKIWAQMVVNGVSEKHVERPYFAMYAGRKDHIPYKLTHDQVLAKYGDLICHHERLSSVFALAIGNYGYVMRHSKLEPLIAAAEAIQERP